MSPADLGWVGLATAEVASIREALAALRSTTPDRADEIDQIARRLETLASPAITIGVYGGLVQWVSGNPFPIRIVDYDGGEGDLPDRDDEGLPCSIWEEAPQLTAASDT